MAAVTCFGVDIFSSGYYSCFFPTGLDISQSPMTLAHVTPSVKHLSWIEDIPLNVQSHQESVLQILNYFGRHKTLFHILFFLFFETECVTITTVL